MYVIEDNVEIPYAKQALGKRSTGPRGELARLLATVKVGQSFLVPDVRGRDAVRGRLQFLKPMRFVMRKVSHEGWRFWRIE